MAKNQRIKARTTRARKRKPAARAPSRKVADALTCLRRQLADSKRELKEALKQQTATADVLKVISSSPVDIRPVFDAILEKATSLCAAHMAILALYNGETCEFVAQHGVSPAYAKWIKDRGPFRPRGPFARMLVEPQPEHIADRKDTPEYRGPDKYASTVAMVDLGGARTYLAVPLIKEGRVIGALLIYRPEVRPFTQQQIDLVSTFADQAVIAIENVRLFKELQTRNAEVTKALEQQIATAQILSVISGSLTAVQPVFDVIAASACRLIGGVTSAVRRLVGDELELVAYTSTSDAGDRLLRARSHLTLSEHPMIQRAVLDRAPVFIEDIDNAESVSHTTPAFLAAARARGLRSNIQVPMMREGEVIGVIGVSRSEPGPFAADDIALLQTFAAQAVIAIENVRLFNETKEALERQTATAEILRVISSSPTDLQPVMDAVVRSAARLCEASEAQILRPDGEVLRLVAAVGSSAMPPARPISRGYAAGRAFIEGRTLHIPDMRELASDYPETSSPAFGTRTILATPLVREGAAIGVIRISRREVLPFTEQQIALLKTFADQAVIAIENVRLFNETKEALEQQTATAEVLRVISSSPTDTQPVFDAIVKSGLQLFDGAEIGLRLIRGDHTEIVAGSLPAQRTGAAFPAPLNDEGIPGVRAIRRREFVHVPDIQEAEGWVSDTARQRAESVGFRALMCAPMLRENVAIGVINVLRAAPGPFTDRQIALLKTFADQAVIAIENVRLFKELQARNADLTELLDRQTATTEILRVISSSPTDIQPVLDAVAESAARLCGADDVVIRRNDGDTTWIAAHRGSIPVQADGGVASLALRSMMGTVARERRTLHIADVTDPHEREKYPDSKFAGRGMLGIRTSLLVPLLREDAVIGAIAMRRQEVRPFSDKQIELLETFAAQAVIAIENVRLFKELQARNAEVTEALEQQTATAEILKVISGSPTNIQPVLDAVASTAARLCGASDALIRRVDGDVLRLVAHYGAIPLATEMRPLNKESVMGRAVLDRKTVHVHDAVAVNEAGIPITADLAVRHGFRTVVSTPLLREGQPIGAIAIRRVEVRPFSDGEIKLLETFADQAVIAIENVRLFKELQARNAEVTESLEQQTATADILKVISGSPTDTQPVFDAIVQSCARLFGSTNSSLRLIKGDRAELVARTSPLGLAEFPYLLADDTLPASRAVRRREVVQIPDAFAEEWVSARFKQRAEQRGFRSIMVAPMLREDNVIGTINVSRATPGLFTDKQVALLKTFADQAVIAIENVRLFNETKDALERQTATSEILRVISSSPTDIQPVFDAILENATHLCDAQMASLSLYDGDMYLNVAQRGGSLEFAQWIRERGRYRPAAGSGTARLIAERQPIHIADLRDSPGYRDRTPGLVALVELGGARSYALVPMLKEGKVAGGITVYRTEVRPFTQKQIDLVSTFADQAVIAIENVRLFNELKARNADVTESLSQQTATADVLKVISRSTFDLEPVLETLVENAQRLCDASMGLFYRLDGDVLRLAIARNADPDYVTFRQRHPITLDRDTITGRAALERQPVHVHDILADPDYKGATNASQRTVLCMPVLREGSPVGVINVFRTEVRPFTNKQIALLQTFADQAAIAIENVRLFNEIQDKSRQLEVASKHKSDFLAHMSHELRTPLNAIIGFSEVLVERMFGEVNAKQDEYLRDIHSSGQHLLSLINDILDLSKVEAGRMELEVSEFHLPSALQNAMTLVRERAQTHGIALGLQVDEQVGQINADERKVKQIVLNLLSNAVKFTPDGGRVDVYAHANSASVEISVKDTGAGIAPEDHGVLFEEFRQVGRDYARKHEGTGLGLALTRRFVELHGGKIRLESAPGQGSTFTFTLPLKRDA